MNLVGVWTAWEPNALDGEDVQFANAFGHDQTGRFVPYWHVDASKISLEALKDYEVPGIGDYYLLAKKSKKPQILNPYLYQVGSKEVLMTSIVFPVVINEKILGVFGVDMALDELSTIVKKLAPYGTGYSTLITNEGIFAAHPDKAKLTKPLEGLPDLAAAKTAIAKGDFFETTYHDADRSEVYEVFVPVKFAHTDVAWSLSVVAPMDAVLKDSRDLLRTQIALSVVALIILSVLLLFTISSITNFLSHLATDLKKGSVNLGQASTKLSAMGETLSESSTEQAAAIQQTVSALEQVTQMIRNNSDSASRSKELSAGSRNAAASGQDAMTKMNSAFDDMKSANEKVVTQVELGNTKIAEISNVISEIGNKTKVINDIAFQTKLLSFNASVEAARSGEHGKGFAVVAEEVGSLAQMSANAAKEITDMLDVSITKVDGIVQEMKASVAGLVEESRDKLEQGAFTAKLCDQALESILKSVNETDQMIEVIATASQEQRKGVEEINRAMQQLDQTINQNAGSAHVKLRTLQMK